MKILLALISYVVLTAGISTQDQAELPKGDAANAKQEITAADILDAQETLARLGYGTIFTAALDEKTREALKLYQERSGLPTTGELDARTSLRLFKDEVALKPPSDIPPRYSFGDSNWNDFFWATGVWTSDAKRPNKESSGVSSRVECVKTMHLCIVATGGTFTSEIHLEWFETARWDRYEITTKPYDLPCGREVMQISRQSKTVLAINTAVYKNVEVCTKLFGPPGKPAINRLSDGDKLIHERWAAFNSARNRLLLIPAEAKARLESK